MLITRIIFGLIAIALGVVTLKYNFQIVNSTSRLEFIESKLGYGSTYLVYKLLSLALIIGGILYITGWGVPFAQWLLSPLTKYFAPAQS